MIDYLAELKIRKGLLTVLPKLTEAPFVSNGSDPSRGISENHDSIVSNGSALSSPFPENTITDADALSTARAALFVERGLDQGEAEKLAARLEIRDQQRDDRNLCLECVHFYGNTKVSRCRKWREIGLISGAEIPSDTATLLQRCGSFESVLGRIDYTREPSLTERTEK